MAKKVTFNIDLSEYSPLEREAIAIEVIDRIVKRTKQGKDKNGDTFAPYSKTYTKSLDFQNAGKSKRVNLELSGDMLDSIEIVKNAPKMEIGFSSNNPERGKAEGNILGTYGQPKPVGPGRDFLGITDSELDSILRKYPPKSKKSETRAKQLLTNKDVAEKLSGRINTDDLEDE